MKTLYFPNYKITKPSCLSFTFKWATHGESNMSRHCLHLNMPSPLLASAAHCGNCRKGCLELGCSELRAKEARIQRTFNITIEDVPSLQISRMIMLHVTAFGKMVNFHADQRQLQSCSITWSSLILIFVKYEFDSIVF